MAAPVLLFFSVSYLANASRQSLPQIDHCLLEFHPRHASHFGLVVHHHESVSDSFSQWPKAPRFLLVDVLQRGKYNCCLMHCLARFNKMLCCYNSPLQQMLIESVGRVINPPSAPTGTALPPRRMPTVDCCYSFCQ